MKPIATINVKKSNYQGVANLAQLVHDDLVAAVADFATPSPTMLVFQSDIDDLTAAIAAWGPVHNRGSHAQLLALRDACTVVYNDLLSLQAYVQNVAQVTAGADYVLMASLIGETGFSIKNAPNPQGALGAPQNLHQRFEDSVSLYTPKLKWNKPLGLTSPGNVKSYSILRGTTNILANAIVIATATKTEFVDTLAPSGSTLYYWVKGNNTDGAGAESMVLQISTPV